MKYGLVCVLLATIIAAPGMAAAATAEDFQVRTTKELVDLCAVSANDPLVKESIHFCHGYLIGALHYYFAASGPEGERLVCLPNPPPTRNGAIDMFVEWARAHPQYMNEAPVETEFRFLMEKWPCKR